MCSYFSFLTGPPSSRGAGALATVTVAATAAAALQSKGSPQKKSKNITSIKPLTNDPDKEQHVKQMMCKAIQRIDKLLDVQRENSEVCIFIYLVIRRVETLTLFQSGGGVDDRILLHAVFLDRNQGWNIKTWL